MKGLDRLRQIRRKQQDVQSQLVILAKNAAHHIATEIGQEIDFPDLQVAVQKRDNNYLLNLGSPDKKGGTYTRPHPQWQYQDARDFAKAVDAGLLVRMGDLLERIVTTEAEDIEYLALDKTAEPQDGALDASIARDEALISVLKHGPMPEALECAECQTFFPPEEVFRLSEHGKKPLPVACPNCGKVDVLLPVAASS